MDHNSWADMADDIARRAFDRSSNQTGLVEQLWAAADALRRPSARSRVLLDCVFESPGTFLPVIHDQLGLLVRRSWTHGWLPYDLVRFFARQFADSVVVAACAVADDECRRAIETSSVDPRWESSAMGATAFAASLGTQRAPTMVMWLELLLALRELFALTVLVPPPGSAGSRVGREEPSPTRPRNR